MNARTFLVNHDFLSGRNYPESFIGVTNFFQVFFLDFMNDGRYGDLSIIIQVLVLKFDLNLSISFNGAFSSNSDLLLSKKNL